MGGGSPTPLTDNHFSKKPLADKDMVKKGLKMHEKRQKMEFLDLKYLLFSGIGGCPPPPLTENHPAQKTLSGKVGVPPTPRLNGKNPLKRFCCFYVNCMGHVNCMGSR